MKIDKINLLKAGLPINEKGMAMLSKIQKVSELKQEIDDLENWFEQYDRKIAENQRNIRLGLPCDVLTIELDVLAQSKKLLLKSKRQELNLLNA